MSFRFIWGKGTSFGNITHIWSTRRVDQNGPERQKCRKTQIMCFGLFQIFKNMNMCQTYDVCFIFNLGNKI
eukprot:UN25992